MVATRASKAKADANKGEKYKARKIKSKIKTNTKLRLNPNPKYKYKSGPILSYVDLLNCHQDTVDFAGVFKTFFDNNENPSDKSFNQYCVSKEVLLEEFRLGFGRKLSVESRATLAFGVYCEQVNSLFKSNRRNATKLHNKIKSGEEVLLKDGFYKHPSDLEFKQNCSYDLGASGSMVDIDSLPYPVVTNFYMDWAAGVSESNDLVLKEFEKYNML